MQTPRGRPGRNSAGTSRDHDKQVTVYMFLPKHLFWSFSGFSVLVPTEISFLGGRMCADSCEPSLLDSTFYVPWGRRRTWSRLGERRKTLVLPQILHFSRINLRLRLCRCTSQVCWVQFERVVYCPGWLSDDRGGGQHLACVPTRGCARTSLRSPGTDILLRECKGAVRLPSAVPTGDLCVHGCLFPSEF